MRKIETVRIDLDDSRVVGVVRKEDRIVIELEQSRNKTTRHVTIRATGVSTEKAEYYVGHKVLAPHPNSDLPLDHIEYAEQGPSHMELQGYLKNDSWYVWRIVATHIEVSHAADDEKPI